MSSSATTTSRSSSLRVPASTSSIGRPPETNRPISSSGRWVAESPMRWNGRSTTRASRSSEIARWAPRFVPGDGVHLVDDHRLDAAQHLPALRGEQEIERLGRRDQDVRRRAEHLAPLALVGVARADADRQRRAEPRERASQVALDVVVERLQRRDVEQPQPLPRAGVEPVDPGEERRQRLARAGRRLHEDVGAGRDHGPGRLLRRRRARERPLEPGARRGREGGECVHPPQGNPRRQPPRRRSRSRLGQPGIRRWPTAVTATAAPLHRRPRGRRVPRREPARAA